MSSSISSSSPASEILRGQVAARWQEVFDRYNNSQPGISGFLSYTQAWNLAIAALTPAHLNSPPPKNAIDEERLKEAFHIIHKTRRLPTMIEQFYENMRTSFPMVQQDIEAYMASYDRTLDPQVIHNLLYRINQWRRHWLPPLVLGTSINQYYNPHFQTLLYSSLPHNFDAAFRAYVSTLLPKQEHHPESPSFSSAQPNPPTVAPWDTLDQLGMLDRYESTISNVLFDYIQRFILDNFSKKWDEPLEPRMNLWSSLYISPWLVSVYGKGDVDNTKSVLGMYAPKYEYHLAKVLCDLRISEIFDIIVDFPDSKGALMDLRAYLAIADQRPALVSSLRKANRKRLLHPGADTKIILAQYVQTIKCLRLIDPQGVLLFKVADPIRRYLRDRPDTIRTIVANLVGDDDQDPDGTGGDGSGAGTGAGDSLIDESEPVQPLQAPEMEDYMDMNWEPEPMDAGPQFRANKPSDVISTLVSIYDSKDLFVKELQILLAQRLLAAAGSNNIEKVEKERRNIEILKVRFGEAQLQVCEVMLKDMTDSKRIDTHVQSKKSSIVHPTIISKHFWPPVEATQLIMPGQFQGLLSDYNSEFVVFKPDKRLRWLPHLGAVHLELELQDRTLDLHVPPLEAAFIELFEASPLISLDNLIQGVGGKIDRTSALKALTTWIDHGVIREEEDGMFRLLEIAQDLEDGAGRKVAITVAEDPAINPIQQKQMEQMKIYWQYIQGALKNLGGLPLDRIQGFLRFAPSYDKTLDELKGLMEAARQEGLVSVSGGLWRLTATESKGTQNT